MSHCNKLPLIPGFVVDSKKIHLSRFPKSQRFLVQNATCMLADIARPRPDGVLLVEEGQVPHMPRNHWLLYDRQVLRFDAYFQDLGVQRKCRILYYLEDDTMQVVEPKVDNSGCYQGTFVHRHRIPLPSTWLEQHAHAANINTAASQAVGYYSIAHLNVGQTIELYGRQFSLVGCDLFTRLILQKLGAFVPENESEFDEPQEQIKKEEMPAPKMRAEPSQKKFLELDGSVLKFCGYWDDRETPEGRLHHLLILYYLADDTLEVRFKDGTTLLKRGRLPKNGPIVSLGALDEPPMLNVLRGQFLKDPSPAQGSLMPCDWIQDSDLKLGATINVFGRPVTLTSCDLFTQQHYRNKFGMEEFVSLPLPRDEDADPRRPPSPSLPPYNGFGDYDDSAANCKNIIPVPPKRNFVKFLTKDRLGSESHMLRFLAELCDQGPDVRNFVISYYLSDDTISIHEVFTPNSGYRAGRFLERCKLLKPNQDVTKLVEPRFYGPDEFYVGAYIYANNFKFHLTGADEYALTYMEKHCNEYPKSNITLVLNKVRESLKPFYKSVVANIMAYDTDNSGTIGSFQLREALVDATKDSLLTEQEILTLLRKFATCQQQPPDSLLRAKVHDNLRKKLFKDLDLLRVELRHRDPENTGYLSRKETWAVCRSLPLPIPTEMLTMVLDSMETNKTGDINHENLTYYFDMEKNPSNFVAQEPGRKPEQSYDRICYKEFIKQLDLEEVLLKHNT